MTKDKERDDALIAEAERLATKATQSTTKSLAWIEECQSALIHLVRSNWQPAPKPDRAEMLARDVLLAWSGYQQLTDEEARSEDFAKACRFTQTALAELRAEWEAERLEIPPHKHYSTPLIERLNGPHEWGYRDPVEGGFIADMSPFEASDRLSELEAERPAVVVPEETGWLVETEFGPHIHYMGIKDPHPYWRESRKKDEEFEPYGRRALVGLLSFNKDSNDGLRFARKVDAEAFIAAFGQLMTDPKATEHIWADKHLIDGAKGGE